MEGPQKIRNRRWWSGSSIKSAYLKCEALNSDPSATKKKIVLNKKQNYHMIQPFHF
jgi:hypothetical protein